MANYKRVSLSGLIRPTRTKGTSFQRHHFRDLQLPPDHDVARNGPLRIARSERCGRTNDLSWWQSFLLTVRLGCVAKEEQARGELLLDNRSYQRREQASPAFQLELGLNLHLRARALSREVVCDRC